MREIQMTARHFCDHDCCRRSYCYAPRAVKQSTHAGLQRVGSGRVVRADEYSANRWSVRKLALLAGTLAVAAPGLVTAAELDAPSGPQPVEVHGFVSQGYIKSTGANFLADTKGRGSSEFTEVGINFTSQLTDRLRLGVQFFARDLGPVGNYSAKLDWFYLDYRWRDWFGLRAGRIKLPFGLYNDTSDIDAARVPILLPQSVYPLTSRDFYLAQTGGEIYGYVSLRALGALDYRIYGGSIFFELPNQVGSPFPITQVKSPYLVGARAMWETPVEGLRLGGSFQMLRLDLFALSPLAMPPNNALEYRLSAKLWLVSAEYAGHDLLVAAEYGRNHVTPWLSNIDLFPLAPGMEAPHYTVSEKGYLMASYRVKAWLQPGAYYSVSFPDVETRTTNRSKFQLDGALTLRFDVNQYWLFRIEGHYMHGTAGVQTALNPGPPPTELSKDWFVFLAKTTAYF